MAKKFYIKETDTYLPVSVNADLTGSSVRVVVRPSGTLVSSDLPNTVTDAPNGEIRITTTELAVGVYELEIEQNQAGTLAHYPNRGYDLIIVGDDL
jgi:hypothetical protein